MKNLEKAKALLTESELTCAICGDGRLFTSRDRGIKPLVALYAASAHTADCSAADKVVGRGAAFMYILMGINEIYAALISDAALSLLCDYGLRVEYGKRVPNIINRSGDGICPFEAAVLDITEPTDAYSAICRKLRELNISIEGLQ